jgi:transposase
MAYIRGVPRNQMMLLPDSVEDYVGPENVVRVIDEFVEGLKLESLGLAEPGAGPGAPSYDPKTLLKLFIYGYLHRIRSSRDLEKAAQRNLEVIWLLARLTPDHWTINEFRRQHRPAFKGLFRQFHLLCAQLELFGRELVAIDGALFKAVNSPARNFTQAKLQARLKEIDERTEAYLEKLEQTDREAAASGGAAASSQGASALEEKLARLKERRGEYAEMLEQLAAAPGSQISLTDPESRSLCKGEEHTVGYNAQIAVDAAHHLIVAEAVTCAPNDTGQLAPMAAAAKSALGVEQLKVTADRGYYSIEQLQRCAEQNLETYVPAQRPAKPPGYPNERFTFIPERDCYRCPQGHELTRHKDTQKSSGCYQVYYNVAACRDCPVRTACTSGRYRKLALHEHADVAKAARERLRAEPTMMRQRRCLVEHPFGSLKFWMGYGAFLTRGQAAVQAEFSLGCLAYNLRRVLNLVGVRALLEALAAQKAPSGMAAA